MPREHELQRSGVRILPGDGHMFFFFFPFSPHNKLVECPKSGPPRSHVSDFEAKKSHFQLCCCGITSLIYAQKGNKKLQKEVVLQQQSPNWIWGKGLSRWHSWLVSCDLEFMGSFSIVKPVCVTMRGWKTGCRRVGRTEYMKPKSIKRIKKNCNYKRK